MQSPKRQLKKSNRAAQSAARSKNREAQVRDIISFVHGVYEEYLYGNKAGKRSSVVSGG